MIETTFSFLQGESPQEIRDRVDHALRREFAKDLDEYVMMENELVEWSGYPELRKLT